MIELAPQALWGRPVVIGGGVAGAMAALTLSPKPVVMLDGTPTGLQASSHWAQGGLAAAVGPDDAPALQTADTIAAGAGLTEPQVADRITGAGPETVAALERFGVRFDRDAAGNFALGLEAAHSRRRVLHVRDATGAAMLTALSTKIAQTPSIQTLAATALRLVVEEGAIAGVVIRRGDDTLLLPTRAVILATGGVGGLWRSTTNPAQSRGGGIALAARAGATLADLEFMQFHPTGMAVSGDRMPLVSEAVRGEGAILIDAEGNPFMAGIPGRELAPRDIVAREVFAQWAKGGSAALDVRHWPAGQFLDEFPNIHRVLAEHGLDPARDPIPVRTTAHYHMGGVRVGPTGRTDVSGLWAAGEVSCTGLHGANRLASNSLLEAAVCGIWAGRDVGGTFASVTMPTFDGRIPTPQDGGVIAAIRDLMDADVGVIRNEGGLKRAISTLHSLRKQAVGTAGEDFAAVALLVAMAAERRKESRGGHFRSDAAPQDQQPVHSHSSWRELD
jgi:L-aspartate oxidase